jgi:hypothetical protein
VRQQLQTTNQKLFLQYQQPECVPEKFEGGSPLIFYNYMYDQLNRLVQQDAYNGFNTGTNSWVAANNMGSMGERLKERIAYDANGNIMNYLRKSLNGGTADMDSLTYKYYAGYQPVKVYYRQRTPWYLYRLCAGYREAVGYA